MSGPAHDPRPIVVVGAGGHAREVLDIIDAINTAAEGAGRAPVWRCLGVVADGHVDADALDRRGVPVLGGIEELAGLDADHVIGIGDGAARRRIDERLRDLPGSAAVLVHPSVTLGADVELAPGVVLAAGARITTNVRLGRHTHGNVAAVVSHDARVGDHVTLSPGSMLNGNVTVGDGVLIGSGAVVTPGRTIGAGAIVGAGAVVVDDIPAGVTAVGVPARW